MNALSSTTRRRLQKLRQVPSVWEGDRRTLSPGMAANIEASRNQGECIIWMDGTEGFVRAMDMVPSDAGHEAIVRTLLQAMEYPHASAPPARPQKIVVCDRELQFYLRGVLQDLDIVVDYAADLPLIEEFFEGLQGMVQARPPELPQSYVQPMIEVTRSLWNDAPWEVLDEEKIISVELNYGDVGTLYVSILGMLGMEYGMLMYRSLDSLKKFRQQVLDSGDSPETLETAFLEQDCLFVTFDQSQDEEDEELDDLEDDIPEFAAFQAATGVRPSFGNLHPLEGMRPMLYDEEACVVLVALEALHRFFRQHLARLGTDSFPAITSRYRIPDPKETSQKVSVKVATLPAVADELYEMSVGSSLDDDLEEMLVKPPVLHNDLVPEDSFYSLGVLSWDILDILRLSVKVHQDIEVDYTKGGDGFPVILIQTSRPKATSMIDQIQSAGGLKAICFNPGEDPFSEERYDLGILQTQNGDLHLFGEFIENDPVHIQARKKWDQRCKKTKGYCGLVIAKGLRGASRGNPDLGDMMALFETQAITAKELGLGSLQLMPYFE
ncbi:hypothetical protein IFO70_16320 [Phormidium tenue FACHB-886]|nr:hypothetical protein [Phormidium tenue FACHB-886]